MRSEAAVGLAEGAAARERVGDDRVGRGRLGDADQAARSLAPDEHETGLLQRRQVARDVRLALAEQPGELPDRELLLGGEREKTQAHRLREHAIELPAGMGERGSVQHPFYIYSHTHVRK